MPSAAAPHQRHLCAHFVTWSMMINGFRTFMFYCNAPMAPNLHVIIIPWLQKWLKASYSNHEFYQIAADSGFIGTLIFLLNWKSFNHMKLQAQTMLYINLLFFLTLSNMFLFHQQFLSSQPSNEVQYHIRQDHVAVKILSSSFMFKRCLDHENECTCRARIHDS